MAVGTGISSNGSIDKILMIEVESEEPGVSSLGKLEFESSDEFKQFLSTGEPTEDSFSPTTFDSSDALYP